MRNVPAGSPFRHAVRLVERRIRRGAKFVPRRIDRGDSGLRWVAPTQLEAVVRLPPPVATRLQCLRSDRRCVIDPQRDDSLRYVARGIYGANSELMESVGNGSD